MKKFLVTAIVNNCLESSGFEKFYIVDAQDSEQALSHVMPNAKGKGGVIPSISAMEATEVSISENGSSVFFVGQRMRDGIGIDGLHNPDLIPIGQSHHLTTANATTPIL